MRSTGIPGLGACLCLGLLLSLAPLPSETAAAAPSVPADAVTAPLGEAEILHLAGLAPLAGRPLDAGQLRGRAVVIAFFASWCLSCDETFERLRLLHLAHAGEGLTVVAVALDEDAKGTPEERPPRLARFLARHEPVFSVVRGTAETAGRFGGIGHLPAAFVFGRNGDVRLRFVAGDGTAAAAPPLDLLQRAVRDALGVGAAEIGPPLPDSRNSVTNSSYFKQLAANRS